MRDRVRADVLRSTKLSSYQVGRHEKQIGIENMAPGPQQSGGAFSQLEHLHSKYVGTGHSETTQHEWATNQHRDSIASYLGRPSLLHYFAVAEGISVGRVKLNLLEKMHRPCGEAPSKKSLDDFAR
ncbi:Splicing factor 3B subunit 10 (SF3b10) [Gracilaria domingensis]|nr:Splicing factor 3B subunit 10 (SF3b10) [Gracilaria domingensis]